MKVHINSLQEKQETKERVKLQLLRDVDFQYIALLDSPRIRRQSLTFVAIERVDELHTTSCLRLAVLVQTDSAWLATESVAVPVQSI